MNKVLILTLMTLSFISKNEGSRGTTITKTAASTTTMTKAKKGTDLLTKNKGKIFAAFLAALVFIIFGIDHLKGKKSQQPQQEEQPLQSQQLEQITEYNDKIAPDFKEKPFKTILEELFLNKPRIYKLTLKDLLALYENIKQNRLSCQSKAAILELKEAEKALDDSFTSEEKTYSCKTINDSITKVTLNKAKIEWKDKNMDDILASIYYEGRPLNKDNKLELKLVSNFINAINKLNDVLLKNFESPNENKKEITSIAQLTPSQMLSLFISNYHIDLLFTEEGYLNKFIEGIQKGFENEENINIKKILDAYNSIQNIVKKNDFLQKYDLGLIIKLESFYLSVDGSDFNCCGLIETECVGKCQITSLEIEDSFFKILTSEIQEKTQREQIQNTLKGICNIVRGAREGIDSNKFSKLNKSVTNLI